MLDKIFLEHEDDLIKATSHKIVKYKIMLDNSELTRNEYEELINDALDIAQIEKATDDMDRQQKLKQAFDALKLIAQMAGGILPLPF